MLIYIMIMLVYMTVGALYSRNRYADLMIDADKVATRRELVAEKKTMTSLGDNTGVKHTPRCRSHEWGSKNYRQQYCNCGAIKRLNEIEHELRNLPNEPDVWLPLLFWPGYGTEFFLKGGTSKKYNPSLTMRLEKELGIGENN